MNKRSVGSSYEEIAAAYLLKEGFEILERNYRSRQGEIDIVAKDGELIVFAEVKYRKSLNYGYPEEAVTYRKQCTIRNTAKYYLYTHGYHQETACRFDVVAILGEDIKLIKDAF